MHRTWILALNLINMSGTAIGQKFLQLEKAHSPKTRKYYPGDEITFQLTNGQWYTRVIEDISYEQKLIVFAYGHTEVDSITALRSFENARWSKPIGNQFFNFAVAWVLFSAIDQAFDEQPFQNIGNGVYIVPASSIVTGYTLKKIFKKRTFRMEKNKKGEAKKWRLRVLDLNV